MKNVSWLCEHLCGGRGGRERSQRSPSPQQTMVLTGLTLDRRRSASVLVKCLQNNSLVLHNLIIIIIGNLIIYKLTQKLSFFLFKMKMAVSLSLLQSAVTSRLHPHWTRLPQCMFANFIFCIISC